MTDYGKVQSTVRPKEIEIDDYSVWKSENIREITVTDENGEHTEYEFNQIQYSKDEYIRLMSEQNKDIADRVTDTQLALCEVYELIGG